MPGVDSTLEVENEELAQAALLKFTANAADISDCEIFIVTVPTPIDKYNRPDLSIPEKSSSTIGSLLKKGDLVIYNSRSTPELPRKSACQF